MESNFGKKKKTRKSSQRTNERKRPAFDGAILIYRLSGFSGRAENKFVRKRQKRDFRRKKKKKEKKFELKRELAKRTQISGDNCEMSELA